MKRSFYFFLFVVIHLFCYSQDEAKRRLKDIDFLAGEWKAHVEARLSAQGPWDTSEGRSIIKKAVNTTVLEEDFTGTREGKPFLVKSLVAVNNLTLKYQRIFIDSEHGTLVDYDGEKTLTI